MKVNLLDRGRRWMFHLSTVLLFTFIIVPSCQSGAILEDSARTSLEQTEIQTHRASVSVWPSSLKRLMQGSYASSKFLTQGINSIFTVSNLSDSCSRDVSRFVGQILTLVGHPSELNNETTVENWALQMLDAWAKPPEGILSGHVNALGDFDECLAVRAPTKENYRVNQFQGKYCLVYTIPNVSISDAGVSNSEKNGVHQGERSIENLLKILSIVGDAELPLIPSVGSCFPSTCSDQEILEIVRALFATINLVPVTSYCTVDEPQKLGTGAIATISFLVVLVTLVVVGTLLELAINHEYISNTFSKTIHGSVFNAFSLISNGKKFLNTKTGPNDVSCLHGIRFLSASWVVLGHTFLMGIMQPLWNIVDTYSMITTSLSLAFITNAAIVVDVFFVMGGFLVSYTVLGMLEKRKGKLNVPLLYAYRYLRITPLYIIIILVGTFIVPLLGSGPYWHVAKTWAGFCEKNWWKNILYINNLPIYNTLEDPTDAPCIGITWYLAADFQLFLLSPFLLFPVWKWKRSGSIPLVLLTLVSIVIPGVLTYVNGHAPTSLPFKRRDDKYSQEAYTPTYMRATPYLVGMCTGLLFHTVRNKGLKLSRSLIFAAWMAAFAAGFAVLFSSHKFLNPEYEFQRGESAIFVSGSRTAWALAISWLIFACGIGYGGWINQILSWRPFVPLGRLTFAIYLASMYIQFLFHLQYRQPIYFSSYHMVNLYFGHLVMSCLIALVCTMLIEAPFMQLLKLMMPRGNKGTSNRSNDSNNNNSYKEDEASSSESVSSDQIQSGYGSTSNTDSQPNLIRV